VPNLSVCVKGDYTFSCVMNWLTSSLSCSIVALLDLADESLGCSSLVIILERSSPNLGVLLHSLMYVGGTVVTKPPYKVDPAFVLVGLEV
jgi:Ornithine decarboxylase antizyme